MVVNTLMLQMHFSIVLIKGNVATKAVAVNSIIYMVNAFIRKWKSKDTGKIEWAPAGAKKGKLRLQAELHVDDLLPGGRLMCPNTMQHASFDLTCTNTTQMQKRTCTDKTHGPVRF